MFKRAGLVLLGVILIGIGLVNAQPAQDGSSSTPNITDVLTSSGDQTNEPAQTDGNGQQQVETSKPKVKNDSSPEHFDPSDLSSWKAIWDLKLFELGGEPVRLSQVVSSLILLILGISIARWATRALAYHFRRKSNINPNAIAMVQSIIFYVITGIVCLIAMDAAGIPINSLAFLGGALAIGMGLGAQNLLNNFLSGLVIMFEQPIRVGDMIRVDDNLGVVEEVGSRCTRIRRTDGIDILVPNSAILENLVVNWTLTDDRVRTSVIVGVAYGSPTEEVRDLMLKAAGENKRVLEQPAKPLVLFDDFGDNSLAFELVFWTAARAEMQLRTLRSELRFRIDALFREAGITIAFPQRDVHIDSLSPLQVQVLKDSDAAPKEVGEKQD